MGQQAKSLIWNFRAKLIPNVLPLLVGVPFWIGAVLLARKGLFVDSIEVGAFGLMICAISLNWLGLIGNEAMREYFLLTMHPSRGSVFVGISRPTFTHWLDPHEDIGFLSIEEGELIIKGENIELRIPRRQALKIGFAFNPHATLGLGRWITIESELTKIRIEPREKRTLRANRALGTELAASLKAWARR